jgi:hypothetical protein
MLNKQDNAQLPELVSFLYDLSKIHVVQNVLTLRKFIDLNFETDFVELKV